MQELKRTFKRIKGKYVTEGRKRKESRRKANSCKRKGFKENLTRVYDILPGCLLYPSSIFVPEMCVDVENVSALLLHRDALYIALLIQENDFTNAGASRFSCQTSSHNLGTEHTATSILNNTAWIR